MIARKVKKRKLKKKMNQEKSKNHKLTCAVQSMLSKSSSKSTPDMASILRRKLTLRNHQPLSYLNSKKSEENSSTTQANEQDQDVLGSHMQEIPGRKYTVYTAPRRFLPGAKLHPFLAKKQPDMIQMDKMECTLLEVLSAMRQIISAEKLYDINNTTVLKLSPEFMEALDMPWCHVTEVKDLTLKQLELVDPSLESEISPTTPYRPANADTPPSNFDTEANYWIKPKLLQVFRSLERCPKEKVVFKYREATSLLQDYILTHQDQFFDPRNEKVANIKDSLLSYAFDVELFHRTQVSALLQKQLILYDPEPSKWPHKILNYLGCQEASHELNGIFNQIPKDRNNPKTKIIMDLATKNEQLFIKFENNDIIKLSELGLQIYNMPITQQFIKREQIQALVRLEASKKQGHQIENQIGSTSVESRGNQVESKVVECRAQARPSSEKAGETQSVSSIENMFESVLKTTNRLESKMDLYECRSKRMLQTLYEMCQNINDANRRKETHDFTKLQNGVSNFERQMEELEKCFSKDDN